MLVLPPPLGTRFHFLLHSSRAKHDSAVAKVRFRVRLSRRRGLMLPSHQMPFLPCKVFLGHEAG